MWNLFTPLPTWPPLTFLFGLCFSSQGKFWGPTRWICVCDVLLFLPLRDNLISSLVVDSKEFVDWEAEVRDLHSAENWFSTRTNANIRIATVSTEDFLIMGIAISIEHWLNIFFRIYSPKISCLLYCFKVLVFCLRYWRCFAYEGKSMNENAILSVPEYIPFQRLQSHCQIPFHS